MTILIRFVEPSGRTVEVEARHGEQTVMELAQNAGVVGILADCGGQAACATCHVYLDDAHRDLPPPPDAMEIEMLGGAAAPRRAGSRLACQVPLDPALSGMTVTMPECQM